MSHVPPTGSGQLFALTNVSGTILATAKVIGSGAVDLTNASYDHRTFCQYGRQDISVATLIKMGVLTRSGATVTENYVTRGGGGAGGSSPAAFPR